MDAVTQGLGLSYFLAFAAAGLKAVRYYFDWKRLHSQRHIIGSLAYVLLALAFLMLIVASGARPRISYPSLGLILRISVILYAALAFVFEVWHIRTWVKVKPVAEIEQDTTE